MAVHFVGFKDPRLDKDPRYDNAVKVFGRPDFLHRKWDARAKFGGEYDPQNDFFVFADGDENQPVYPHTVDDSTLL